MSMEEMLAEIIAKLEQANALLRSAVEQPTPSSPPSTSKFPADTEEREAIASTMSTKPATTSLASLIPSPTSASPQDADLGFQSGSSVTELSYIHHTLPNPPVSTDDDLGNLGKFHVYGRTGWIGGLGDICAARGIPFAHGASRLESHASPEADIAVKSLALHRPAVFIASSEVAAATHANCSTLGQGLDDLALAPATPAPPLDFALVIPTTNSDNREHEVTNSATSKPATVPSASPTPSPSSESSQEAAFTVNIATMEHSLVTPARCSTVHWALDTGVLKALMDSWTSSTPSSTSAPPSGNPATLISTHNTCSTLGLQANICPNYAKVAFLLEQSLSVDVSTPEESSLSDSPPTLVADIKLNGTNSSLCAFSMNDFALKGMLHHEKVFSELQQPWPPPDPFLVSGDQFNLCGNQLVVECGGLQPKPPWSLVFPEDDSTNYDPSKHMWLLLLDSGKNQTLLLSSIPVKIHSSVHVIIAVNINLQLIWHFSEVTLHASYSVSRDNSKSMELCHHCISDAGDNLFNISSANHRQAHKMPKPPWLLGTEVFLSWSGKNQLISGFLLEVSPWCRDYMVWAPWQQSMPPSVLLKMASSGTNLQLLPCLFTVCTGAEAKQSKFLLVLMFGICYVELPVVHSDFHSYILAFEVLPGKPIALHFICRNDGKFLPQPWPPPTPHNIMSDEIQPQLKPWSPDHLIWFTISCHDGLRDGQDHNHIWSPFCYNFVLVEMWQHWCRRGIFAIKTEFMDLTNIWKALGKMSDMILYLQPWALYGQKQVRDQKVELGSGLGLGCLSIAIQLKQLTMYSSLMDLNHKNAWETWK